jgi:hypothetical protein
MAEPEVRTEAVPVREVSQPAKGQLESETKKSVKLVRSEDVIEWLVDEGILPEFTSDATVHLKLGEYVVVEATYILVKDETEPEKDDDEDHVG